VELEVDQDQLDQEEVVEVEEQGVIELLIVLQLQV